MLGGHSLPPSTRSPPCRSSTPGYSILREMTFWRPLATLIANGQGAITITIISPFHSPPRRQHHRGILTGRYHSADDFDVSDFRWHLLQGLRSSPRPKGVISSRLVLAWVLAQGQDFIPSGTKIIKYLEENIGAANVTLSKEIRKIINSMEVHGVRHHGSAMKDVGW
ncbi:hypothetical protein BC938DRAFT_475604 [Jimgerdemannia flammicorona]|uniref:NADP-dependent oxidoreductase domain-containing protein n=1 Tax=Jimgerdemannia flammicorona TaxID=994334 RepID=A0A433QRH4_9FUNG|nr:hypothetical protein BC938DRAFT_475604 [Jimgerdemannia flammicorona]